MSLCCLTSNDIEHYLQQLYYVISSLTTCQAIILVGFCHNLRCCAGQEGSSSNMLSQVQEEQGQCLPKEGPVEVAQGTQ